MTYLFNYLFFAKNHLIFHLPQNDFVNCLQASKTQQWKETKKQKNNLKALPYDIFSFKALKKLGENTE